TLRPAFWEETRRTRQPAGVPEFRVLQGSAPRAGALLDGALASVLTFTAVCLALGYSWNHPRFMPIVSYYRTHEHRPTRSQSQNLGELQKKPTPPVYVDGGRLILFVQNPSTATSERP